jgi:hypothetical protein
VTGVITLRLEGASVLDAALGKAARRLEVPFAVSPSTAPPALVPSAGGVDAAAVPVAPDRAVPVALFCYMLGKIIALSPVRPRHVTAVVMAPAGGVCGPAAAGPVDAIRHGGTWDVEVSGVLASVRVLAAQQTRCWLASCTLHGVAATASWEPIDVRTDVEVLPGYVITDTARVCEFMQDRGLGDDWPQIALLGAPAPARLDDLSVLVAFTEGGYARDAIVSALSGQDSDAR